MAKLGAAAQQPAQAAQVMPPPPCTLPEAAPPAPESQPPNDCAVRWLRAKSPPARKSEDTAPGECVAWDHELLAVVRGTLSKEMREFREDLRHFMDEQSARVQQLLDSQPGKQQSQRMSQCRTPAITPLSTLPSHMRTARKAGPLERRSVERRLQKFLTEESGVQQRPTPPGIMCSEEEEEDTDKLDMKSPKTFAVSTSVQTTASSKDQAVMKHTASESWRPTQRAYARWRRAQQTRNSYSNNPLAAVVMEKVGRKGPIARAQALKSMSVLRKMVGVIVDSDYFDYTISAMLVLNAVVIGLQADYMMDNVSETSCIPPAFKVLNIFFCLVFAFELCLRVSVDSWRFWSWFHETWKWNWFDTINVTLSVFEEFLMPQLAITYLGVVRALRICRVARLVRMVRLIPELKSMVYLILASTSSFVWTCILMTILMYSFAVYFTELVTEMVASHPTEDMSEVLRYWGSIERSILSLFQAMTGGASWHVFVDVFDAAGVSFWFNAVLFSIYIAFTTLVVLNLVTGVFVEGAQRIVTEEREEALINLASKIFMEADLDCSACLDKEEFERLLTTSLMDDFLRETGLRKSDANRLFHVFDEDTSGDITLMEFVSGCLRLNSSAKATDVRVWLAEMRYEMRVMSEQLFKCFGSVEEAVFSLNDRCAGVAPLYESIEEPLAPECGLRSTVQSVALPGGELTLSK